MRGRIFQNNSGNERARFGLRRRRQLGFSLVESLVAVAILGSVVFMLLGGLTTGSVSIGVVKEDTYAENTARAQMEYTKSLPYNQAPYFYNTITEIRYGYSVTAEAAAIPGKDANIQEITVTVYSSGTPVYTLQGYKVNR